MSSDWNQLTDNVQVALSREALYRAADLIAMQAEVLAGEIENGNLPDHGGADALRLFAAVVRASDGEALAPQGMAEEVMPWPAPDVPSDGAEAPPWSML